MTLNRRDPGVSNDMSSSLGWGREIAATLYHIGILTQFPKAP